MITLVDGNPVFENFSAFLLYAVSSMFLVVIMLNLIISVISDVYDEV